MELSGEVWFPLLSRHQSCSVVSCYLACEFHLEGLLLVQTPERFGLMQRLLFPKRPLSHTVIYVSSWKFFCYPHANLLPAGVELWFFKSSSVWAVSRQGEQLDCCLSICTSSLSSSLSQDIGHALNVSIYSVLEVEELICDELWSLTHTALSVGFWSP